MQYSMLGTLEVRRDGQTCDLGPPKQRALLIRLLIDVGRPVSVDRLIDDLWAGAPPGRATASLQAYVSNLRRILEPDRPARTASTVLVTQPPGYALRAPAEAVDAVRFRTLAAAAAEELDVGAAPEAHANAVSALSLWRGPALADVADEPFAAAEISQLDDLRLSTEEVRLAAALDIGRIGEAVAELETLVVREPLRERFWELLVLGLYRGGRAADALARYQRVRELLDEELGLEPGPVLRELEQAVLRQDPALLPPRTDVRLLSRPAVASETADASAASGDESPGAADEAAPTSPRLDAAGRPPLVGREEEVAVLASTLEAAAGGVTRWTMLTGEAGMGKTRLAEAARDLAMDAGWSVTTARCHEDAGTPAHWLWAEALDGLAEAGPESAVSFAGLAAQARAASGDGDGEGARFALYRGIERALSAAAATRPVLVVLDDLQWADVDSLRALRFLAVQLRDTPLAIVATIRDGEGGPVLQEVLATVDRQPGAQRIAVPPVDLPAVRTIAEAVTGEPMDAETGRQLHERSGGNPFFATELVRLASAAGRGGGPLPHGVRDAVRRRLARLPDEVRAVLILAAVAGDEFDTSVIAPAAEQSLPDLLDLLDPALATGAIVGEAAPLRFRFAHGLLRDVLLAELTMPQRQRLHARLARALQQRSDPGDRVVPELAHHLVEAGPMGDLAAAPDAAFRAGTQALQRLAFDEAARWFSRALEVGAQRDAVLGADHRARHEMLVATGRAMYGAGRAPEAREALVTAIDVAAALDDTEALALAAAALSHTGGIWTWVDLGQQPHDVLERLERALAGLDSGDTPARARLLSMLAIGSYFGGDPDWVDRLSQEALDVARRVAAPGLLADVLLDRAFCRWTPDGCAESLALADEALRQEPLSDLQRVVAQGRRFVALLFLGDLPGAVAAHGEAVAIARTAQLLGPLMQLAHLPVARATAEGRFADAEALLAESWALHERGDVPIIAESIASLEVVLDRHRGRLADRVDFLTQLIEVLPIRAAHQLLALAHLEAGDAVQAEAALRASAAAPTIVWMALLGDTIEAEVRSLLPPTAEAEALADALAPYADMVAAAGTNYWWAPVALPLGALEHALGRLDDAERHLRKCIERSQYWGTRTWTAQAQWHLAAVLATRGGAEAEAAALQGAAQETAEEIGMALPVVPGVIGTRGRGELPDAAKPPTR